MGGIDACERELSETSCSDDDADDLSDGNAKRLSIVIGGSGKSCDESESLSDIDDAEVNRYLNNDKETHYKKMIWEKMNQQYLQEQELKKAAAATNATKPKKQTKTKRGAGVSKAKCTTEKNCPTSEKKRTSSRINYDVLNKALGEPLPSNSPKKRRTTSDSAQKVGGSYEDQMDDEESGVAGGEEDEYNWDYTDEREDYNNYEDEYNFDDEDDLF